MQHIELELNEQNYRSREAYSTLRTNIEFSGENIKIICLTSCTPNEGKSTTSFELARSYAMNGKRTLLIDADLRKSVSRSRVKEGKLKFGLSSLLVGKSGVNDTICETNVPNLYMIFAGQVPPNPAELLDGGRFEKLIQVARRSNFDMIIIDCPPLGAVIDAAIIAKYCDGAIIVIESGAISYHFARKVKEQLSISGCKILGCVLNKVSLGGNKYYGKYYGRYYGKYYGKYYGNYSNEEEKL